MGGGGSYLDWVGSNRLTLHESKSGPSGVYITKTHTSPSLENTGPIRVGLGHFPAIKHLFLVQTSRPDSTFFSKAAVTASRALNRGIPVNSEPPLEFIFPSSVKMLMKSKLCRFPTSKSFGSWAGVICKSKGAFILTPQNYLHGSNFKDSFYQRPGRLIFNLITVPVLDSGKRLNIMGRFDKKLENN